MMLHTDQTPAYLSALSKAMALDATAFAGWFMIHLPDGRRSNLPFDVIIERICQILPEAVMPEETTVLLRDDGDIVILARGLDVHGFARLGRNLPVFVPDSGEVKVLELSSHEACETVSKLAGSAEPLWSQLPFPPGTGLQPAVADVFVQSLAMRRARSPLHVMIVEDDTMTRRLVSSLLKEEHVLALAKDAESAIANYLIHAPDIVFLDINLPGQNGFEILGRILRMDPRAYVVMFSGNDQLETIVRSLLMGAKGFVAKPFDRERLAHYIGDFTVDQFKSLGQGFI